MERNKNHYLPSHPIQKLINHTSKKATNGKLNNLTNMYGDIEI